MKERLWFNWFMALVCLAAFSGTATAGNLPVTSYDMPNGDHYAANYYWDFNYTGSWAGGAVDESYLSGGKGLLTNGVIPTASWNYYQPYNTGHPGPWVGWYLIDPTITFHFGKSTTVNSITFTFDNPTGYYGNVAPPKSVVIQGITYNTTIPAGNGPTSFRINGPFTVAESLPVTLIRADVKTPPYQPWIMLGEVVFNGNNPPTLQTIGNKTTLEGQTLQFTVSGSDPDGDALTYEASNLPTGATFNPATRTFTWTPNYNQAGTYQNVILKVTDNGSPPLSASQAISITVGNADRAPILEAIGSKAIVEGQLLQFTVSASDPDGDSLTYSASNLPTGAAFDPLTGIFSWTPGYQQAGSFQNVLFSATDGALSASEAITITVGDVNRPPVLSPIGNKTANEGDPLEFTVTATDPDGNVVTYTVSNLPPGASFDSATQKFSWTPAFDQAGSYQNVLFTASDTGAPQMSAWESITITVSNVNRPPALDPIGSKAVNEDEVLRFTVSASDPDGGSALVFDAGNLPAGASFDPVTRTFAWAPSYSQSGVYQNVVFRVTDNGSPPLSDSEFMTITVGNVNRPPALNPVGNKTGSEGSLLEFTVTATDPDADGLTYSVSELPRGASFDATSQKFSWTPYFDQAGNFPVTFTVTDNGTPPPQSASETVIISVNNVNRPPVLTPVGSRSIDEKKQLQFYVTGSDPDGNQLSFTVTGLPEGATFDPQAQLFTWTPEYGQAGQYNLTFTATDNGSPALSASETITITVAPVAIPITVTAEPKTKVYGDPDPAFTYQLTSGKLLDGTAFSGAPARAAGGDVGEYAIGQGSLTLGSRYTLTFVEAKLTITPAPLTVTANNTSVVLNTLNPVFTVSYSGFKFNDGPSSLGGALTFSANEPLADVGLYTLTPAGLTSGNYAIKFVSGSVAVVYSTSLGHQILPPLSMDSIRIFKQGSTVPAKFQVFDANGNSIGAPGVVKGFYLASYSSGAYRDLRPFASSTTHDTAFRWDPTEKQWIFNMSTKGLQDGNTYYFDIVLKDGSHIYFGFGLKSGKSEKEGKRERDDF